MCIVSLSINKENQSFILTHNRDEKVARSSTDTFITNEKNGLTHYYPKDSLKGGTWFLVSDKIGGCILNGEFKKHNRKPNYAESRGHLLLSLLNYSSGKEAVKNMDLSGMEAFTMVVTDPANWWFGILVWDESVKHIQEVTEERFSVRSSSTLYDSDEKNMHYQALLKSKDLGKNALLNTHRELRMLENTKFPGLQTTSICQWRFTSGTSDWEMQTKF